MATTDGRSREFWRECNGTEDLMSGGCRDEVALPHLARTGLGPTHQSQNQVSLLRPKCKSEP